MENSKKTTSKKKLITEDAIISIYMDFVLENNAEPKNVYSFCKAQNIEETDFYKFFRSIDILKQEIWVKFFENAMQTLNKDEAFESYSNKNKLLSLFFTLFEIFTLNRSYIVFSLKDNKEGIKNLKSLKQLRSHFKDFISSIVNNNQNSINEKITKITKPVFSEGAWIQFLFILKFWLEDTSPGFEKTDVLIEKSVNTGVDLINTQPIESLFDLGKFLWKEKMN